MRRSFLPWVTLAVLGLGSVALAQTPPDGLTFETVEPPRGTVAQDYLAATRGAVQTGASYATEVHGGDLTSDSRVPRQTAEPLSFERPAVEGNLALLIVVGGLGLLLFLWLRFAGGGVLGAGPKADKAKPVAPDHWDLSRAEDRLTGEALIASIAAMPDRRAAMVRLLRHCLLLAAERSDTRLARSDTERRVLARLPAPLRSQSGLTELLRRTELAHYGGRPVTEAEFAASLAMARMLFAGDQTRVTGHKAGVAHA